MREVPGTNPYEFGIVSKLTLILKFIIQVSLFVFFETLTDSSSCDQEIRR
jgi:hypothetical protein